MASCLRSAPSPRPICYRMWAWLGAGGRGKCFGLTLTSIVFCLRPRLQFGRGSCKFASTTRGMGAKCDFGFYLWGLRTRLFRPPPSPIAIGGEV